MLRILVVLLLKLGQFLALLLALEVHFLAFIAHVVALNSHLDDFVSHLLHRALDIETVLHAFVALLERIHLCIVLGNYFFLVRLHLGVHILLGDVVYLVVDLRKVGVDFVAAN